MPTRILFLDDMQSRHDAFEAPSDAILYRAYTADRAIKLLDDSEEPFDIAYLDHDLSDEDIMCEPGGPSRFRTGMDVVDHIVKMVRPPRHIVIHSWNGPAAAEMRRRLIDAWNRPRHAVAVEAEYPVPKIELAPFSFKGSR